MTDFGATHWALDHIGTPWVAGMSDCWSFARTIWADRFGWDVPALTVDPEDPRAARHAFAADPREAGWQPMDCPREGDAVLMARGARPCHVGIWISPDPSEGILHSVERAGVIFTAPARLSLLGYRITGWYRRAA
jgi:cell wall-associated NlpC family hydrolase